MSEIIERQKEAGWLLPYLLMLDAAKSVTASDDHPKGKSPYCPKVFSGTGRWEYWGEILETNVLPEAPIPQLDFAGRPQPNDEKAIAELLQVAVRQHFTWYPEAWLYFVKWLLHGFGRPGLEQELERIPDDLKEHWYTQFNLANLLNSPCDWSAFILQGGLRDDKSTVSPWAKSTAFYSTPMPLCKMMAQMTMGDIGDARCKSVHDPCCGTGSQLLTASNYSLLLYGTDIVYDLCLCAELNGWLWMPWLVAMPARTRAMLEGENAVATGVFRGDSLAGDGITVKLAEERRKSAEDFQAAVRDGKLTQAYLWGEE